MTTVDSLSVVLPIYNGAHRLARRVGLLLELLPEITVRFEILILDNGSADQTEEIAYDLARSYPQLRVARHSQHQPEHEVIQTGMQQTSGTLIVVYDERAPINEYGLRRMWELRHNQQLVIARPRREHQSSLIQRLATWAAQIQDECVEHADPSGIQIIRRRALQELEKEPGDMKSTPIPRALRSRRTVVDTA